MIVNAVNAIKPNVRMANVRTANSEHQNYNENSPIAFTGNGRVKQFVLVLTALLTTLVAGCTSVKKSPVLDPYLQSFKDIVLNGGGTHYNGEVPPKFMSYVADGHKVEKRLNYYNPATHEISYNVTNSSGDNIMTETYRPEGSTWRCTKSTEYGNIDFIEYTKDGYLQLLDPSGETFGYKYEGKPGVMGYFQEVIDPVTGKKVMKKMNELKEYTIGEQLLALYNDFKKGLHSVPSASEIVEEMLNTERMEKLKNTIPAKLQGPVLRNFPKV